MKLKRVILREFLNHQVTDVELDKFTVIAGKNGAGKSAIRDAIKYALIGRARSTDAAGRGAERLVRAGAIADDFLAAVVVAKDGQEWRIARGNGDQTGVSDSEDVRYPMTKLDEILGYPRDVVEAVLDLPRIFTLDPAKRSEIIGAVVAGKFSLSAIDDALFELMQAIPRARTEIRDALILLAPAGEFDPNRELLNDAAKDGPLYKSPWVTLELLAQVYDRLYEARRVAKTRLAAIAPKTPGVVFSPEVIAKMRSAVKTLEAEIGQIQNEIGKLEANRAEYKRHSLRIAELRGIVAAGEPPVDVEMVDSEGKLGAAKIEAGEALTVAEKALDDLEREESRLSRELSAISDGICPSVCAPKKCPYLEDDAAKRNEIVRVLEALRKKKIPPACDAVEAAAANLAKIETALVRVRQNLEERRVRAERFRAASEELRALGETPAFVDSEEKANVARARLEEKQTALSEARQALADADRSQELADAHARAKALRTEVETLEDACRCLEPKALPARLTDRTSAEFVASVNRALSKMTGDRYAVTLESGKKGVELHVWKGIPGVAGSGTPVSVDNLSTSERLRLGAALGMIVAIRTGIGIVLLDDGEILDRSSALDMTNALRLALDAGVLETVVVFATKETPGVDRGHVRNYWIENGKLVPASAGVS